MTYFEDIEIKTTQKTHKKHKSTDMDTANIISESQAQKQPSTIPENDQLPTQQDKPSTLQEQKNSPQPQQQNPLEQQKESRPKFSEQGRSDQQHFPTEHQPTASTSSPLFDPNHISPSRSALSDQLSTPSKSSSSRSKLAPIDALTVGLLSEFKCLKDLETQLEQIVNHQQGLIENVAALNGFYTHNEELMEAQLMVS